LSTAYRRASTVPCSRFVLPDFRVGTDSDVLSETQARCMVDVLPRGELVRVPGIGHAPTLVEPVVLAAGTVKLRHFSQNTGLSQNTGARTVVMPRWSRCALRRYF
jgi:hypothetical protein